jgi:hypothetical protein
VFDVRIGVKWCRRDPETLGPTGDSRIVDWLRVNAEIPNEKVGYPLAFGRVANDDRDNVAGIINVRNGGSIEKRAQSGDPILMPDALEWTLFKMSYRG